MAKPKFKIGSNVRLTKRLLKWKSNTADEIHGYPELIKPYKHSKYLTNYTGDPDTVSEQLTQYFMAKYSFPRNLNIDGLIVWDNGYEDEDFAYLVWTINELGEDLEYIAPRNLELL